jgi:formylglycine-generating enzyme required for sulfatase activity
MLHRLALTGALLAAAACSSSESPEVDDAPVVAEGVSELAAATPSCGVTGAGLSTCGSGNESCCAAIDLGTGVKLDKFQVTAGRMRQFLKATRGDVAGWYAESKAALRPDAVAQLDAYASYLPRSLSASYQALGGFIYLPSMPSAAQGCFVGDATNPGYGSHTYPLPSGYEPEVRGLSANQLAAKALNCVPYPLAAAFCAWDGGRLQTNEEHDLAYGAAAYPWGASPIPGGWAMVGGLWTFVSSVDGAACPTCDVTHVDWSYSYAHPATPSNGAYWDYAIYVLEPGRLPAGNGPLGHADLAGNLMEWTGTFPGTSTTTRSSSGKRVAQPDVQWTKNGSWEGHPIGYEGFAFPIMTKYGKTGLRCAR